jgi:hypothetical protein
MIDQYTQLALDTVDSILDEHKVTIWAVRYLASNSDAEKLGVLLRVNNGMRKQDEVTFDDAESIIETAENMYKVQNFQKTRINLLVALCGAIEYSTKAFFVDGLINRPQMQKDWEAIKSKVKVSSDDTATTVEQYFGLADDFWRKLAKSHPPVGQRLISFINEKCASARQSFNSESFNVVDLNEAFLVRNAFVHNGGKVTLILENYGFCKDEVIGLDIKRLHRYVTSMVNFCEAVRICTDRVTVDDL